MTTKTFPDRVKGEISSENFNTPGTVRGPDKAIRPRQAMGQGMVERPTPRTVKTNWEEREETGRIYAPGITHERAGRFADRREDGRDD